MSLNGSRGRTLDVADPPPGAAPAQDEYHPARLGRRHLPEDRAPRSEPPMSADPTGEQDPSGHIAVLGRARSAQSDGRDDLRAEPLEPHPGIDQSAHCLLYTSPS